MTHQPLRPRLWLRSRRALLVAGALVALLAAAFITAGGSRADEVERLLQLLDLRDGMTVAEIGAGTGWLTVEVAREVGASGRVYSTELSQRRLDDIREAVATAGLANVTIVAAAEGSANLPRACCEAIFMRRVYHHFTDPAAITGDLYDALLPGGRLVIIEFKAGGVLGLVTRMGIDQARLTDQVTSAGFELVSVDEWSGWDHYVAVFQKSGRQE